jgi:molybdopterin-guanine dinucleotide biosynthesis protein A
VTREETLLVTIDDAPRKPLTGIVLAGGRSSRFGSDKASALLAGRPMLQWVISAAAQVCDPIVLVTAKPQDLPPLESPVELRHVTDRYPESGPLAGLVTGMAVAESELCFAASCDTPLLRPGLIAMLREAAPGHDVVCPEVDGYLQPLAAIYRVPLCLPLFEEHVRGGRLGLHDAFATLNVRVVSEAEVRATDPALDSFLNVNRPALIAEAEARLAT